MMRRRHNAVKSLRQLDQGRRGERYIRLLIVLRRLFDRIQAYQTFCVVVIKTVVDFEVCGGWS